MRDSDEARGPLGAVESQYVEAVRRHLGDVPHGRRRQIIDRVVEDLAERPDAETWEQLTADLGDPRSYAEVVRNEHGLPSMVARVARVRSVRARTWVAAVLMLATTIGAIGYVRWTRADPGLVNSCTGVRGTADAPSAGQPGVEIRSAAGATEHVVSYRDGVEVRLGMCISARAGVEVVAVAAPDAELSMFQQASTAAADATDDPHGSDPVLDGPVPVPEASLRTTLTGRMANCEFYWPGDGMGFDAVTVTYRYRGRTRTTQVGMGTTYTFLLRSEADCPRPRPR